MNVVRGLDAPDLAIETSVLSVGNFDGVHRGHQQLLAQGGLLAAHQNAPLVVVTFEPHPLVLLRPSQSPGKLKSLDDKLEALRSYRASDTHPSFMSTDRTLKRRMYTRLRKA